MPTAMASALLKMRDAMVALTATAASCAAVKAADATSDNSQDLAMIKGRLFVGGWASERTGVDFVHRARCLPEKKPPSTSSMRRLR